MHAKKCTPCLDVRPLSLRGAARGGKRARLPAATAAQLGKGILSSVGHSRDESIPLAGLPGTAAPLMGLLELSSLLLLLWPQQLPEQPAFPHATTVAVGHPEPLSSPGNTSFVLPCIHEEHEFAHRRRYLAEYHKEQPLKPRQRTVHFGHCWQPLCFRGVYDAFTSREETDAIFRKFEPQLKSDEARNPQGQGAYIGYSLKPRNEDPTLMRVVSRMSALLEKEFGARGAVPASVNLRSAYGAVPNQWREESPESVSDRVEQQWLAGQALHSEIAFGWHYDNTKKMDWLYTCLLYLGTPDNLPGGATLFVDELSSCPDGNGPTENCISAGMMVAPTRSRLLCFSSGPENVHSGSSPFGGYRVLLQVWFKCDMPEEDGKMRKSEL